MRGLFAFFAVALLSRSNTASVALDEERTPWPYVISVKEGLADQFPGCASYFFKMTPDPKDKYDWDKGFGFAYQVGLGQDDKLLWKTDSWFAFQVFLARDGRHLVRLGNWPSGTGPKAEDLAIAFYDSGKLLKTYSTLEVISDQSKVHRSASHYKFLGDGRTGFFKKDDQEDGLFRLSLIDGTYCLFHVDDGSLVRRG